jgi:hypothetical protein
MAIYLEVNGNVIQDPACVGSQASLNQPNEKALLDKSRICRYKTLVLRNKDAAVPYAMMLSIFHL